MLRKTSLFILCLSLILAGFSPVFALIPYPETVSAELAAVRLVIGGEEVDNAGSLYPLLLYSEITYLPLTYNYMRALGVESRWSSAEETLYLDRLSQTNLPLVQDLLPADGEANLLGSPVSASVVNFPVLFAGEELVTEGWPYLLYREITYLPLTWANATALGLDYDFDLASLTLSLESSPRPHRVSAADIAEWYPLFAGDGAQESNSPMAMHARFNINPQEVSLYEAIRYGVAMRIQVDLYSDPEQGIFYYANTPIQDEETLLQLDPWALYVRPDEDDAEVSHIFRFEDGIWSEQVDDSTLAQPLSGSQMSQEEVLASILGFDLMDATDLPGEPRDLYDIYRDYLIFVSGEGDERTVSLEVEGNFSELPMIPYLPGEGILGDPYIYSRTTYDAETLQALEQVTKLWFTIIDIPWFAEITMTFDYEPAFDLNGLP